jgi:pimeloyl-ACP methyl ester carboxylesterase
MLNWYRALLLPPARKPPARITVPVRVIWGDHDRALERGLAEEALSWCDKGEVLHLPSATHWLHHEESGLVNTLLLEFLESGNAGNNTSDNSNSPNKKRKDRPANTGTKAEAVG